MTVLNPVDFVLIMERDKNMSIEFKNEQATVKKATAILMERMSPPNYIEINRTAYDALADGYRARREPDRKKDSVLIRPFVRLLREQFRTGIHILDLGCGNGLNLSMFADEGFTVTGIDLSARRLEVAGFLPFRNFNSR